MRSFQSLNNRQFLLIPVSTQTAVFSLDNSLSCFVEIAPSQLTMPKTARFEFHVNRKSSVFTSDNKIFGFDKLGIPTQTIWPFFIINFLILLQGISSKFILTQLWQSAMHCWVSVKKLLFWIVLNSVRVLWPLFCCFKDHRDSEKKLLPGPFELLWAYSSL